MKRNITYRICGILAFSLILGLQLNAQPATTPLIKRMYAKFYAGYSFFTPGSYAPSSNINFNYVANANIMGEARNVRARAGIGYGTRIGGGIGFVKNDFMNIGLDVEFQLPYSKASNINFLVNDSTFSSTKDRIKYSVVTLTPYLLFKALAKPKYFIYNKVGVLFTMPMKFKKSGSAQQSSVSNISTCFHCTVEGDSYDHALLTYEDISSSTYDSSFRISMGIGVNLAFGINMKLSNQTHFFAEVFGNYVALTPTRSSTVSNYRQFTNILVDSNNFHREYGIRTLSSYNVETTYKNGGVVDLYSLQTQNIGFNSEGYDENRTTGTNSAFKHTINMSAIGINVGIIYRF